MSLLLYSFGDIVVVDLAGCTILKQACCGGLGLEELHTKGGMVQ